MTRAEFFKHFPLVLGASILGIRASDERIEINGKHVLIQNTHLSAGLDLTNCPQVSIYSNRFDLENAPDRSAIIITK